MTEYVKVSTIDLAFALAEAVGAGRQVYDDADVIVDAILGKLPKQVLNTPAETRTGISDRDAELMSLMGAVSSGIRSALYRVTNNRPEPLAPLEHARTVVSKAMALLAGEVKSDG